jgi:hypothetical protein
MNPPCRLRNEASDHLVVMRAMFIAYWVFILLGFAFSLYIGIANR